MLGLGYEREDVRSSVHGNLMPLHTLRWLDKSLDGVLAGYHGVPDIFVVSIVKDTTQPGHTDILRLIHCTHDSSY